MHPVIMRPVRFTIDDVNNAGWCFNCGPGALCAVLNLTPTEIRPLMGDFESKGYTNPTLMWDVLNRIAGRTAWRKTYRGDDNIGFPVVKHGLVRVQWGGPWTRHGVPMRARYRHTHWVAMRDQEHGHDGEVFDVNAMCVGGWIPFSEWHNELVPWLCRECVPKWDGHFWPTHAIEVTCVDCGNWNPETDSQVMAARAALALAGKAST